tara:strand:+ start:49 stop:321 length:273 start_codon:yes stop_codon:yes gene_type:complete
MSQEEKRKAIDEFVAETRRPIGGGGGGGGQDFMRGLAEEMERGASQKRLSLSKLGEGQRLSSTAPAGGLPFDVINKIGDLLGTNARGGGQ